MPNDFSHERSITVLSTLLFGVTSYWTIRRISRDRHLKANSGKAFHPDYDDLGANDDLNNELIVSPRCRNAMTQAMSYLKSFLRGLEYTCTPESLDGFILLCVAENKLAIDLLSDRLQNTSTTISAFSDPIVYCYNSFLGLPVARQAVSYFLAKRFLHTPSGTTFSNQLRTSRTGVSLEQALQSVNPDHIGIGSGASGILNGKMTMGRAFVTRK
jgi:hypothetical protein